MCYFIINKRKEEGRTKDMSKTEEIKKQIEELEDRLFFLNMKDRWTMQDREREMQLNLQLANLKKQLIEEQKE